MLWPFFIIGACSGVLTLVRIFRARGLPQTPTQLALTIGLASVCLIGIADAVSPVLADAGPVKNAPLATWHALLGVLIASFEVVSLTLADEEPDPRKLRAIVRRGALVVAILVVTWPLGFSTIPTTDLSPLPRNPALLLHLVVFHSYVIWGLGSFAWFSARTFSVTVRRRPIKAVALILAGVSCGGFALVNLAVVVPLLLGHTPDTQAIFAPTAPLLAVGVGGLALLACGDRITEEVRARRELRRLTPLWDRVVELCVLDVHLSTSLPAPARLQRAYVEISDGICHLRTPAATILTPAQVVTRLRDGNITDDLRCPTLSTALPARHNRREDLELIHELADLYRA